MTRVRAARVRSTLQRSRTQIPASHNPTAMTPSTWMLSHGLISIRNFWMPRLVRATSITQEKRSTRSLTGSSTSPRAIDTPTPAGLASICVSWITDMTALVARARAKAVSARLNEASTWLSAASSTPTSSGFSKTAWRSGEKRIMASTNIRRAERTSRPFISAPKDSFFKRTSKSIRSLPPMQPDWRPSSRSRRRCAVDPHRRSDYPVCKSAKE